MIFNIPLPFFFNLDVTMDTEQCPASFFFWKREGRQRYSKLCHFENNFYQLTLFQKQEQLSVSIIPQKGKKADDAIKQHAKWLIRSQFRFNDDFHEILQSVSQWPEIAELFSSFYGVRLMRDDNLFARVCDSLCSQNTSISHLNRMMANIVSKFGERVELDDGNVASSFPTVEVIANSKLSDLRECGLGYRANYVLKSSQILADDPNFWSGLESSSLDVAEQKVRSLPGVGPKVGGLILMFGVGRTDVFPVDLWVLRGLKSLFNWDGTIEALKKKSEAKFGNHSAYANNCIFYALRKGRHTQLPLGLDELASQ